MELIYIWWKQKLCRILFKSLIQIINKKKSKSYYRDKMQRTTPYRDVCSIGWPKIN